MPAAGTVPHRAEMPKWGWGGPYVGAAYPADDGTAEEPGCGDLTKTCLGGTTVHGAPRYYEEGGKVCRKIFWACAFVAGISAGLALVAGTITEFASSATSSSTAYVQLHGRRAWLPSVTICHSSPVRCRCSGFYKAGAGTDPARAAKYYEDSAGTCTASSTEPSCRRWQRFIAPYMCSDTVALRECGDSADCSCRVENSSKACEHPDFHLPLDSTRTRAAGGTYQNVEACGNSDFLYAGKDPTLGDLYRYAGFTERRTLVAGCVAEGVKDFGGDSSGSCIGDKYWDPVWFSHEYGACHTFNGLTVERKWVNGKCEGAGCICVCVRAHVGPHHLGMHPFSFPHLSCARARTNTAHTKIHHTMNHGAHEPSTRLSALSASTWWA